MRTLITLACILVASLLITVEATAASKIDVGGRAGQGNETEAIDVEAHDRVERRSDYKGVPPKQQLHGVPVSADPLPPELVTSCGLATQEICDLSVATPRPIPNRADPASVTAVARDYFRSIPVPAPAPSISAPNGGITGAEHSLDLRVSPEWIFTDPATQFGTLTLHVYGSFTVDWGDGTQSIYKTSGAPWPNSDIKHSWSRAGRYDIKVTARWTADWSLDGYQGTLGGLQTSAEIPAWPVTEAQAVLVR